MKLTIRLTAFFTVVCALFGCAAAPEQDTAQTVSARCEQTGSNLPRRECRSEVEVLKPQAIESL
ncbi:MAG: hypothetical protein ACRDAM_05425, partial [Casimicrobium sp.]